MSNILAEGIESLIKDPKALEDYSNELSELLPKVDILVKGGRLIEATELMLLLEKKARVSYDAVTVVKILKMIVSWYKMDIPGLCEILRVLMHRRGQLKRAISDTINLCISWLSEIGDIGKKRQLMRTIEELTEGKIFVEAERSRVKLMEAHILEKEGKVNQAAEYIENENVEVCAGMDSHEKTEYIIEQMRLVLCKGDYIKLQILSKKINTKILKDPKHIQDYNKYLIQYYTKFEQNYLQVAQCYLAIHDTVTSVETSEKSKLLESVGIYTLCAPIDGKQKEMLVKLSTERLREMEHTPSFFLIKAFLGTKLIVQKPVHIADLELQKVLKKRIVQFNLISVISVYYTRATIQRLSEILGLSVSDTEMEISELAIDQKIYAKIDRPSGVVIFNKRQSAQAVLDSWSENIYSVLNMVQLSSHLIEKERLVHAAIKRE
jgi:26S proteasome regulatory subunit N5